MRIFPRFYPDQWVSFFHSWDLVGISQIRNNLMAPKNLHNSVMKNRREGRDVDETGKKGLNFEYCFRTCNHTAGD